MTALADEQPKVGKVDWQVLDQLPALHGI